MSRELHIARRAFCGLITLVLLLGGTAAAQETGTISGTLTREEGGGPISGATVLVVEIQRATVTGKDGTYALAADAGEYTVLASATGYTLGEERVTVGAGETSIADFSLGVALSQFGEELVVIGSRAARSAIETPAPVDVLASDDMLATGMSETSRIIQFLAPSFNHSTSTISDGTDIVRPSTLRGLGPDQTLVLVNGKRRHGSALVHVNGSIGRGTAGVDLNAIPAAAIGKIEVLRDGAAAQYGSDAIAGVLNINLNSQLGTQVSLYGGRHFEGDGEVFQAAVSHGFRVGRSGYLNLTGDVRDRGSTNRAGLDPRQIYKPLPDGSPDPREAAYDRLNHRYGDAASENLSFFVNGSLPTSGGGEVYLFGGLSERDGESAGFNRLPSQGRTNVLIHPDGHLPLINTSVDDISFSLGYRDSFSINWSVDAGVTTGGNAFNFFISNSANTSLGAASPTEADAGTLGFDQTTVNLDVFGVVGTASVAFGAEWREDSYEIEAGAIASWVDGGVPDQFGGRAPAGIQVFPGFRPSNAVDASRDNVAVYGDVEWNPSEQLLVGLAARYEDYSDFGDTVTGKLALRYEVSDRFALRGTASTGFRAPSLHQSNFNNISTQFVDVDGIVTPLEVGTFRVDSEVAQALGARPLAEETSTSFSLGFTSRPQENLSVTVDAFSVDIDDRIVISGRFSASNPQIGPILEPFGVNAAQFFTNAIDTETQGVDLVIAYTTRAGSGTFDLTGAANWNETEVVGEVKTPPELAGLGETLFPLIDRVFVELAQPRELYNLSARYSRGKLSAMVRANKFGAVTTAESNTDPTAFQTFSSKWLADLDLSYQITRGVRLHVGANNLFDELPDENIARNSFNGIFVFPRRTAPFGFNGGFYYTRLTFDF